MTTPLPRLSRSLYWENANHPPGAVSDRRVASGKARTFLVNWLLARRNGWCIVLRIDDLDAARIRPEWSTELVDDLSWLGLTWDSGPDFQAPAR